MYFFLIFFWDLPYRNSAFNVIVSLKKKNLKNAIFHLSKHQLIRILVFHLWIYFDNLSTCFRWTNWWTSTAHVVLLFWGFPAISSVIRRTAVTRRFCLFCFTFDLAMDLFQKLRCSLKSRWAFKIGPVWMSVQQTHLVETSHTAKILTFGSC